MNVCQVNLTDRESGFLFQAVDRQLDACSSELARLARLDEVNISHTAAREKARQRWIDRQSVYLSLRAKLAESLQ